MTEDSNMQRMTEAEDEYFADALTNMQPHCDELVSRLTDAIRGLAMPRAEEALIPPFDGSYAANNFNQQLERTSEGPQDDATLQARLRALLKGEPLFLYNELNLASLPYSKAKQTLMDLYPGKSEVTFTKFLTFKLNNQIQLVEYYRQKITMGLQLGLTNPIRVEALTEGLQANDQRLMRAIAPKTLNEWYSTMTRIKGTSSLPTPSEPFQGVSNTSAFHRDIGIPSRGRNYNPFSTNNTPRYPSGARRPPSPCKYCQGDHWNSECSMNRRPYRQQAYHGQPTAHYFPPEQNGAHNLPVPATRTNSDKIIALRPYRTSLSDQREIQEQVGKMLEYDIIEPSFSPYSSPVTLVTKKDKTKRFCVDYRRLNEIIFPDVHPLPLIENILDKLANAKIYSRADFSSAYWSIEISPPDRNLLSFVTLEGQYNFKRLPYGIKIGPQVYERAVKMVKQGIVTKIYHETEWSHPMVVVKKKSGQIRICLDPRKLNEALVGRHFQTPAPAELLHEIPKAKYYTVLDVKSAYWHIPVAKECRDLLVRFLGHLISQNEIDPEPNKIDKLITFKRPEDKKSLQRIMGLYNYLGKFIPNLAASTSNIRGILRKNVVWHWGPKQDGEFDLIKECVRNAPSLAHFDKSKMLILQCDASKDAMGAALLQEDRPLAFASASFSDSQKQYSQIEKELLSVYYGCKKFEYLLSGHTFVVQTDYQPLLPLVKKPLSDISPRLQRLVMKLIAFDFKLQYKPGKYLIVADTLSRDTHPMDELPTPFLEDKRMVKMVRVNISDEKLVAMQKDTREDPALVKVIDYVIEGWPICKKDVDEDAKVFFDFRHRLYLWNDLLCIGSAIVIPKTQRNNMLNLLHQSHQGISAIQGLARESLFWPRMSIDIAEKVKNCEICQKHQKSKIRQPLKPFPVPDYPWQTVSLNIFYIQKKPHLLVVDRYSGYPEVFTLDPPTAINVKNKLRETFARFGIPETMMSDNGPPFRSEIMTDFCIRWGIKQLFSSPHLHRSNGLAERNIQTIKNQLIKCRDEGSDPYLAILAYRNTPKMTYRHPHSYVYRGAFDVRSPELHRYIDRIKLIGEVNVGEDAWCQIHPRETWTPVKISAQADSPQSFEVVTPSGNRLIINQQFIRPRDGGNEKASCPQNQLPPPQKLNIRIATVQRWASHPQPRCSGQVRRPILTRGKARLHLLGFHQNHPEGPGTNQDPPPYAGVQYKRAQKWDKGSNPNHQFPKYEYYYRESTVYNGKRTRPRSETERQRDKGEKRNRTPHPSGKNNSVNHRAETDLPHSEYATRQFFQAYDRKMEGATPDRLPGYLTRHHEEPPPTFPDAYTRAQRRTRVWTAPYRPTQHASARAVQAGPHPRHALHPPQGQPAQNSPAFRQPGSKGHYPGTIKLGSRTFFFLEDGNHDKDNGGTNIQSELISQLGARHHKKQDVLNPFSPRSSKVQRGTGKLPILTVPLGQHSIARVNTSSSLQIVDRITKTKDTKRRRPDSPDRREKEQRWRNNRPFQRNEQAISPQQEIFTEETTPQGTSADRLT
ncbi:K02A2.6-like [Cordylochernes scorpioides]|uniref:RNA-directed DNA polymerase n=1 Tax=Cordylochernes scorpioides TaxID=51811 RepID=A0ABY6LBL5_9ARAC|nr:K02A2.6-like [Cordylochernes scorpioides]